MTSIEILTAIKDVLLSMAAITGAIVAVKGLSTWRRQLKGQSEYELSRRILVSLYKYRDSINGLRNPIMMNYEMPHHPDKSADFTQQRFYGVSRAYDQRWEKTQKEKTSLYADLLEAEAIWGAE